MAIRYIRQRKNSYDCGPVAIINACKYYGEPFKYKDIKIIRFLGQNKFALNVVMLDNLLRFFGKMIGFSVTRVNQNNIPTLNKFREFVSKEDNVAVLCYLMQRLPGDDYYAHYVLCIGYENNKFIVVNDEESQTISYLTNIEMNSYLKFGSKKHRLPDVWLLKRKKVN